MNNIVVHIQGQGTLWVGCTVYPPGGEVELPAVRVSGSSTVKFNVQAVMANYPMAIAQGGRLHYVVALWQEKINLAQCERKYGKNSPNCQWARANGYQMEGRLDQREGDYVSGL